MVVKLVRSGRGIDAIVPAAKFFIFLDRKCLLGYKSRLNYFLLKLSGIYKLKTSLESVIAEHRKTIAKQWFERVIAMYPPETGSFLGRVKDRFSNPVAGSLSESLEQVLDGLASGANRQVLADAMDAAIRVRAVQNFSASESVAFIFFLKDIIGDCIARKHSGAPELLAALDKTIDGLALIAFDKYMECREKIYHLQAYEMRNRTFKAFERAGLVVDNNDS